MSPATQFSLNFLFPGTALLCMWGGLLIVLRNLRNIRALPAGVGLMLWSVPYVLRTLKINMDESVVPCLIYTGILAYLVFASTIIYAWFRGSKTDVLRRQCIVAAVLLVLILVSLMWEFVISPVPALIVRSILLIIVGLLTLWELGIRRYFYPLDPKPCSTVPGRFEDPLAPRLEEYAAVVREWFEEDKPYLDPSLKLADTACKLPINRSYLSRVYNEGLGKGFTELVRDYRLQNAVLLLEQHADMPVGEVAKKSGFGSMSSFHRCFTAVYGMSPVEFRSKNRHP